MITKERLSSIMQATETMLYEEYEEILNLQSQNEKLQKVIDKIRKKYLGSCDLVCDDCGFNTRDLKDMLDEVGKYDYTKRVLYFEDCGCKILSDGDDNKIEACKKHIDLIIKEIHEFNPPSFLCTTDKSEAEK